MFFLLVAVIDVQVFYMGGQERPDETIVSHKI
jgi:hypothetical protein